MPTRRACLALSAAALSGRSAHAAGTASWRGFNLMELIDIGGTRPFNRSDFRRIREWGFTFVRLPMDYRCVFNRLGSDVQWNPFGRKALDDAMEWASAYGLHVNLAFHRAPGYCVKPPPDRYNLWTDEEAQRDFYTAWEELAKRYRQVSATRLSINLVNEPNRTVDRNTYARICSQAIDRIRLVTPDRPVTVDGLVWGRDPVWLDGGGPSVIQSTRGYHPEHLTKFHFAQWNKASMDWPVPTWPLYSATHGHWDEARLHRAFTESWGEVMKAGKRVHVGEFGVFSNTPHEVALAFMASNLRVWNHFQCGWALWQFRGPLGIINSDRADVDYVDTGDGKLDERMLNLLRG